MSMPIVKIKYDEVAMTSAHSKIFANIGRTAANNMVLKIGKILRGHIIDGKITKFKATTGLLPENKYGLIDGAIFENYVKFDYGDISINFEDGHTKRGKPFAIDKAGNVKGEGVTGSILQLLDIPSDKIGNTFSEVRIKGANVPISIILASWLGLSEFLKLIGVSAKEYDIGRGVNRALGPVLRFKDVKLQLDYSNMEQMLLVNGLLKYESVFKEMERDTLDKASGWKLFAVLFGLGRSQERTIVSIQDTWIDPITNKLLIKQGYPTEMVDLFLAVNRLLSTSEFNREADGDYMFLRGYDRLTSIAYREILSDGLVSPTEDTSPLNLISNQTRIGYGGNAGRSDQSMQARHRVFDPNDRGVISEAGTDDGKTGTILKTSVNPNFDSIYGTSSKDKEMGVGNQLSASTLAAPFSLHDELKRTIFAGIQGNAMIYAEGYRIMSVYTGMGPTIAAQVNGNYLHVAAQDGVVVRVTDKFVEVKYADRTLKKLSMGRAYSRNSGKILPKKLVTDVKRKDTFKAGDILIWDMYYFDRSMIDPMQVEMFTGSPTIVAIKDEQDTYEDSHTLSKEMGDTAMSTKIIHNKAISASFKNEFKLLVKVGDMVSPNTKVAIISPEGVEITEDSKSLDFLSQIAPKAGSSGEVVRIEVFYIGDKADASPGIRKVINKSDAMFKEESEYLDVFPSGSIKEPTFISKQSLEKDSIVVNIYIEHLDKFSVGDKSSFANALKTVNGYAWNGRIETIGKIRIDAKFSGDGIFRRVVTSALSLGLLNLSQYTATHKAVDIYRGRVKY